MNRFFPWLLAAAVPFVTIAGHDTLARAQVQVVVYPPAAYIASYEPVYYNGFAHYLYRDHWYYRDHGAWRGYDREPDFLRARRGEWAHHWHHWR